MASSATVPRPADAGGAPYIPAAANKPVLAGAQTLRRSVGWGLRADRWLGALNSAGSLLTLITVAATVHPFGIGFAASATVWIGLSLIGSGIQWWSRRKAEKAHPTEVALVRAATASLRNMVERNPAWANDAEVQEFLALARFFERSPGRMVLNNFTAPARMVTRGVRAVIASFRSAHAGLDAPEDSPPLAPQSPVPAQASTPLAETPPLESTVTPPQESTVTPPQENTVTPPIPPRSALRRHTVAAPEVRSTVPAVESALRAARLPWLNNALTTDQNGMVKSYRDDLLLEHPQPFRRGERHASLDAQAEASPTPPVQGPTPPPKIAVEAASETPVPGASAAVSEAPAGARSWAPARPPTPVGESKRARRRSRVPAVPPIPGAPRQDITPSVEPPHPPNPTPAPQPAAASITLKALVIPQGPRPAFRTEDFDPPSRPDSADAYLVPANLFTVPDAAHRKDAPPPLRLRARTDLRDNGKRPAVRLLTQVFSLPTTTALAGAFLHQTLDEMAQQLKRFVQPKLAGGMVGVRTDQKSAVRYLRPILPLIESASKWSWFTEKAFEDGGTSGGELLQWVSLEIGAELAATGRVLFGGTVQGVLDGEQRSHALLYEVFRNHDGSYRYRIYNTGTGAKKYHHQKDGRLEPFFEVNHIDADVFEAGTTFFLNVLKRGRRTEESFKAVVKAVYEHAKSVGEQSGPQRHGTYVNVQTEPNCAWRVAEAYVQLHSGSTEALQFQTFYQSRFLEHVINDNGFVWPTAESVAAVSANERVDGSNMEQAMQQASARFFDNLDKLNKRTHQWPELPTLEDFIAQQRDAVHEAKR